MRAPKRPSPTSLYPTPKFIVAAAARDAAGAEVVLDTTAPLGATLIVSVASAASLLAGDDVELEADVVVEDFGGPAARTEEQIALDLEMTSRK
ncbi:MAG: hypothetical protein Q9165_005826 [Trypethelium subeluteriae]